MFSFIFTVFSEGKINTNLIDCGKVQFDTTSTIIHPKFNELFLNQNILIQSHARM